MDPSKNEFIDGKQEISQKIEKEKKVIIKAEAYKTIILFSTRYANDSIPKEQWKEIYGVLIGYITEDAIIVEKAEPMTSGEATDVELGPEHYAFIEEINNKLFSQENQESFLVGWFHSHPGLSLFYSFVDIKNQMGFQGPNDHSFGLVFDHTYLLDNQKHPNHPGFEIYRLNDPNLDINDPRFDTNYHKVEYEIVGLNEFFFANVLTELSANATMGNVLQKSYGEKIDKHLDSRQAIIADQKRIKVEAKTLADGLSSVKSNGKTLETLRISKLDELSLEKIPEKSNYNRKEEEISKIIEKIIYEGRTSFVFGDFFEAVQKYESALDIMERSGEEFGQKIIVLLTIITESCLESEHDNLTLKYADKLKEKAENLGDLFQMGNADYFKGISLIRKKEVQQGLTTLKNSAIFFEKTEDFAGVGRVNRLIGNQYLQNNDFCSAGLFYMETIKNYNLAIQKFHPKRNTSWSLPQKLEESVEQLKTVVSQLIEKMDDEEIKKKIIQDLKLL